MFKIRSREILSPLYAWIQRSVQPKLLSAGSCDDIHIPKVHLEITKRSFYSTSAMEFNIIEFSENRR